MQKVGVSKTTSIFRYLQQIYDIVRKNAIVARGKQRLYIVGFVSFSYIIALILTCQSQAISSFLPKEAGPQYSWDTQLGNDEVAATISLAQQPVGWHCENLHFCDTLQSHFRDFLEAEVDQRIQVYTVNDEVLQSDKISNMNIFAIINIRNVDTDLLHEIALSGLEESEFPSSGVVSELEPPQICAAGSQSRATKAYWSAKLLMESAMDKAVARFNDAAQNVTAKNLGNHKIRVAIPTYISLLFGLIFSNCLLDFLVEKTDKHNILLAVHGVTPFQYFMSWLFTYLFVYGIYTLFPLPLILSFGSIFPSAPFLLVFCGCFLFYINILLMACTLSLCFDSEKTGLTVGNFANLFLELFPTFLVLKEYNLDSGVADSAGALLLGFVLPSLPFYRLCSRFSVAEVKAISSAALWVDTQLLTQLWSMLASAITLLFICVYLEGKFRKAKMGRPAKVDDQLCGDNRNSVENVRRHFPNNQTLMSLSNVYKTYPAENATHCDVVALQDLSLTVSKGEVVCLLGRNGAGKSTSIDIMTGKILASAGVCAISNVASLAVCLQDNVYWRTWSVGSHVDFFRRLHGRSEAVSEAAMRLLGLDAIRHTPAESTSGGEQRRLALAFALMAAPSDGVLGLDGGECGKGLLVLDEPSSGVDVHGRQKIWDVVLAAAKSGEEGGGSGLGVLLTTHYLDEAETIASRQVVLVEGKKVFEGSSSQLKALNARGWRLRVPADAADRCKNLILDKVIHEGSWEQAERMNGQSSFLLHISERLLVDVVTLLERHDIHFSVNSLKLEDALPGINESTDIFDDSKTDICDGTAVLNTPSVPVSQWVQMKAIAYIRISRCVHDGYSAFMQVFGPMFTVCTSVLVSYLSKFVIYSTVNGGFDTQKLQTLSRCPPDDKDCQRSYSQVLLSAVVDPEAPRNSLLTSEVMWFIFYVGILLLLRGTNCALDLVNEKKFHVKYVISLRGVSRYAYAVGNMLGHLVLQASALLSIPLIARFFILRDHLEGVHEPLVLLLPTTLVASCQVMLYGYVQSSFFDAGEELLKYMPMVNLLISQMTLMPVVTTAAAVSEHSTMFQVLLVFHALFSLLVPQYSLCAALGFLLIRSDRCMQSADGSCGSFAAQFAGPEALPLYLGVVQVCLLLAMYIYLEFGESSELGPSVKIPKFVEVCDAGVIEEKKKVQENASLREDLSVERDPILVAGLTVCFKYEDESGGEQFKFANRDVNLRVARGEIVGLLGVNGAGKTTLMKAITQILSPRPLAGFARIADGLRTGYCPQDNPLWQNITGIKHIEFYCKILGIDVALAPTFLTLVGLSEKDGAKAVEHYSGGMRRRLSLACAVIGVPDLIILDEPTSGVDASGKRLLWKLVLRLKQITQNRVSVLITSHSMEEAERLSDKVAIMGGGRLLSVGSVRDVKSAYGSGYLVEVSNCSEKEVDELCAALEATVQSRFGSKVTLQLPRHQRLSSSLQKLTLFRETSKPTFEYSLRETSLEQVFLDVNQRFGFVEEDETALKKIKAKGA